MQGIVQQQPWRRGYFSQRKPRRPIRGVVQCESLENRQLLSTAQINPSAVAPPQPTPTSAELGAPANAGIVANRSQSNVAGEFGSATNASTAQLSFLLGDFVFTPTASSPSVGAVATTAPISTNPATNIFGSTLTLTNLSVTALNPQMTSFTDAIIDDQVNADAFLVPSTTELLEDNLGERAPTPVTLWNTTAFNSASPIQTPPQPVQPVGPNPVSNRGQSLGALPDVNPHGGNSPDFSEPPPAPETGQGPQAQPLPQPRNAPAQPGANPQQGATAPEKNPVPQPAPIGEQAAPQGGTSAQTPRGEKAPAQGAKPRRPVPPMPDLDQNARPSESTEHPSQTLSVIFGSALLAAGGHHLALRRQDRSQGRAIPRWYGAERPTRRKTTTGRIYA